MKYSNQSFRGILSGLLCIISIVHATSVPVGSYNYAQDNKYTILYVYTGDATSLQEQKKLVRIFSDVAHDKRYARSGLRFRASYVQGGKRVTAEQLYGPLDNNTVIILREGRPYENARMVGTFSRDRLEGFIEQWLGDYLNAILDARKESKRAATAVAYASYPPYWGYPYYGAYGWGYPYGYGYGMGIYF